ncbi:hypothetical protein PHJA_002829600 [Phtheirospermum japonicum]|uniref:Uncharacterized protein n=1 Tax=Phtheirospermum japonicum TaxID=374723 RepID=A0A830DJC7_9LAMI|nr:hypothetical protein PHJA_002829600 [Phtheirospermum japonicum]
MSSTGASYAAVYVQQKRQKERLKRIEEERARSNEGNKMVEKQAVQNGKAADRNKKVHPAGFDN